MPSRFQVFSATPAPFASTFDCWPDSAPPTLTRSTTTPGIGLEHDPRIARRRQLLKLIVADAGGDGLAARIDDERLRGHLHGLGDAADLQRDLQRHAAAGGDFEVAVAIRVEAAQRRRDGVGARRQVEKVRFSRLRRWSATSASARRFRRARRARRCPARRARSVSMRPWNSVCAHDGAAKREQE